MRLRKPCEHGRYEPHPRIEPHLECGIDGCTTESVCPGGEFLADDALVRVAWCAEHQSLILGRIHDSDEPYCLVWTEAYSESTNPEMLPVDCREVQGTLILESLDPLDAFTVREGARMMGMAPLQADEKTTVTR